MEWSLLTSGLGRRRLKLSRSGKELLRLFGEIWRFGEVLDALSTRGRYEEWGKRRAMHGFRVLREGREFYLDLLCGWRVMCI
ncbi:hypothetical protein Taro_056737 [Colocasia esculenta]|uniref:Uncharacterized protein n=1 Tax=Colocasia esculenta TaxID=4460 RepID=A0A843XXK9_COLES|nr:hypothetical protein [Colocasia esculenta]